jgi:hypothetical protein
LAYADDNFLQAPPEPTTKGTPLLTLAGPLGLHPKLDKCAVYSADAGVAASVGSQLGVHHAPDSLLAAETPVGTPVPRRPCRPLRRTCLPLDGEPDSPTPGRSRLLTPPTRQPTAKSGPSALGLPVDACRSGGAEGRKPSTGLCLCHLRPAQGTRTIHCTDDPPPSPRWPWPILHQPGRRQRQNLAATATTHQAMVNGPEAFRPIDGSSRAQLRSQWASLHDRAGTLWLPEYQEVSPDSLGTIAAAQREFPRHTAQTRADALRKSFDPNTTEGRSGRARLLSCACRPASTWLDTLPLTKSLELESGEVCTGLRRCLGISMLHSNAPAVQCDCGTPLRPTDVDHGMRCPSLSAHTTLRPDILKGILGRVVHRAGITSTQEPALSRLPGLAGGAGISASGPSSQVEARGAILLALPGGITIADISVFHPLSINTLPAAATTAWAAAARKNRSEPRMHESSQTASPLCPSPWRVTGA